jgi:N-acetylmuramic acid 6-phosphate etherase
MYRIVADPRAGQQCRMSTAMTESEKIDLEQLTTEAVNPGSADLDRMGSLEIVRLINAEDAGVAGAVARVADDIAAAIDVITERLSRGGRLVYVGAGTSGRLGVLDAAECPPTFNAEPGQVMGLIAGGQEALLHAVEGAEDSHEQGRQDLAEIGLGSNDAVVGIAASGRTPYVLGALEYARNLGAATIGFSCNPQAEICRHADLCILPLVGPEVLAGSTRMKAGTATKMVLNMLTTGAMVRLGKTYGNLMVDVQATNKKLVERSIGIVQRTTGCTREQAIEVLERCGGDVKTAITAQKLSIDGDRAKTLLDRAGGHLRKALQTKDGER